jgi:hypothetical protein
MSVSGMSATDRTKNRIKGRAGVIIGTLFLQAGRWPDALKELTEAVNNARASSDYIWHAKALETILLCLLMFGWAGMDFQVCEWLTTPSITLGMCARSLTFLLDSISPIPCCGQIFQTFPRLSNP